MNKLNQLDNILVKRLTIINRHDRQHTKHNRSVECEKNKNKGEAKEEEIDEGCLVMERGHACGPWH